MRIDDNLISYLEKLSCLLLSEEEKSRLAGELEKIIGYMARLSGLDTAGVAERSHPFDNVNALREDIVAPSMDRALLLQNAPDVSGGMIVAPKTVEQG